MEPSPSIRVDELKQIQQPIGSPVATVTPIMQQDRTQSSAARRAEQRKAEQERRRREAVSIFIVYMFLFGDFLGVFEIFQVF